MKQLQTLSLLFKCPMAFSELIPCNGGYYCHGCQKIVHDFRGKTEDEIKTVFAANGRKLCGMFEADRIQISTPLPKWRKWAAAAVLTLGFNSLHQTLMAQQISKADSIAFTEKPAPVNIENTVFGNVAAGAEFPGGLDNFFKFLVENIKPNVSSKPGQKAIVQFVIGVDGMLSDFKIRRSPFDNEMNAQIIEVLKKSPPWKPGQLNGKLYPQQYVLPVIPLPKSDINHIVN
jgi:hypothetical protein